MATKRKPKPLSMKCPCGHLRRDHDSVSGCLMPPRKRGRGARDLSTVGHCPCRLNEKGIEMKIFVPSGGGL